MDSRVSLPDQDVTKFLVETLSKSLSKSLSSLSRSDEYRNKPSIYRRTQKHGTVDDWITLMRRHLVRNRSSMNDRDRAWVILENLEGEARSYGMSKPEHDIDGPEKVFLYL